jgi:hypothetical protein
MFFRKSKQMGSHNAQPIPEAGGLQPAAESTAPLQPHPVPLSKEQQVEAVKGALEAPDYNWRTIDGIARDTGLAPETIGDILLKDLSRVVIRLSVPDEKGRALYTTREHYRKTQPTWNRILSAVSGIVK